MRVGVGLSLLQPSPPPAQHDEGAELGMPLSLPVLFSIRFSAVNSPGPSTHLSFEYSMQGEGRGRKEPGKERVSEGSQIS